MRTTRQATQVQPALLAELQALHHTHREATRLFLMAASQGATDDALRQGLPHLTDPASLLDQSFDKQPQGIGIQAEQGKQDYQQTKRTRNTSQATQTQPLLLAADAFAAALEAIPSEDWRRTWSAIDSRADLHLDGWQDDHAEKDLQESETSSRQDAPACRCPLEQQLQCNLILSGTICSERLRRRSKRRSTQCACQPLENVVTQTTITCRRRGHETRDGVSALLYLSLPSLLLKFLVS